VIRREATRTCSATYLATARSIRIIDPYVRQEFQVRNIDDLLTSVRDSKGCRVELVTMYERNDRYGLSEEVRSRERLDALKTRLERKGFLFAYRFDPEIHDRMIETEKLADCPRARPRLLLSSSAGRVPRAVQGAVG